MAPAKYGNQVKLASYYPPEAVEQLKGLSDKTRIPQAVLLREALDDLLALNKVGPVTDRVREVRNAFKKARAQLVNYRREIQTTGRGATAPLSACEEAIGAIDRAREEYGD